MEDVHEENKNQEDLDMGKQGDVSLSTTFAFKIHNTERTFNREILALKRLNSVRKPRVAPKMNFYDHHTLSLTLKRYPQTVESLNRKLTSQETKAFIKALAGVHHVGMRHGDISAENAMIDGKGGVKLIDFGSARVRERRRGKLPELDPELHDLARRGIWEKMDNDERKKLVETYKEELAIRTISTLRQ